MLNIAVGKFGITAKFDQRKWGMTAGDSETPVPIVALANTNPDINFYLIGKSDFSRLDPSIQKQINPHGNIIDPWINLPKGLSKEDQVFWLSDFLKDVKFDFGMFCSGPSGHASIPEKLLLMKEDKFATPSYLTIDKVGPITNLINETGMPWIEYNEDPRYFPTPAVDILNDARFIACAETKDDGEPKNRIEKFGTRERIKVNIPLKDCKVPHWILIGEPYDRIDTDFSRERENVFSIYSNGIVVFGAMKKLPVIEEFVFKYWPETKVYGEWRHEQNPGIEKYPDSFLPIPMAQLQDQMRNTKYTLMIPVSTKMNHASSKFLKMVYFGIIPFMHEACNQEYFYTDLYGNIDQKKKKIVDFLVVKNGEELKKKVDILESDKKKYMQIRKALYDFLSPEYFNGRFINAAFRKMLFDCGIEPPPMPKDYNYTRLSCQFPDLFLTVDNGQNTLL